MQIDSLEKRKGVPRSRGRQKSQINGVILCFWRRPPREKSLLTMLLKPWPGPEQRRDPSVSLQRDHGEDRRRRDKT